MSAKMVAKVILISTVTLSVTLPEGDGTVWHNITENFPRKFLRHFLELFSEKFPGKLFFLQIMTNFLVRVRKGFWKMIYLLVRETIANIV